jgi:hypothetical protein
MFTTCQKLRWGLKPVFGGAVVVAEVAADVADEGKADMGGFLRRAERSRAG